MPDVLLVGAEDLENLSTRSLAAVLRQNGFSVRLASFSTAEELEDVVALACDVKPTIIGLSVIFQYRAPEFLSLARRLKQVLPLIHITIGGHFPSFAAPEILRDYAETDSVVRGEGEITLLELTKQICSPESWDSILGLTFRRAGHVIENPARPLIENLDSLPFPSRDTPPQYHLGIGVSPIIGSRGCYRDCSFCSIRAFYGASRGHRQRFRSVKNVVDEMEVLYYDSGVRFFIFNDDEWFPPGNSRHQRISEFESELGQRQLDVIMSIKCRADDVDESVFKRLLDMGIVRAYIGIESGSAHSLQTLNKRTTVEQNRRALQVLNQVGMLADFGMIFFDPESTVEDIRANLTFFREVSGSGESPLSFGRLEVYAGTPILENLTSQGRLTGNYLAWNYTIRDLRVELLFRMMFAILRNRYYSNAGLGKQCSLACYELMMYRYRMGDLANRSLAPRLRSLVACVNNDSLDLLEEMLRFSLFENIFDANRVNDNVVRWATQVNKFDLDKQAELNEWRNLLQLSVNTAQR